MQVKDINECDFINYKKPSMFIAFPKCTFKCDKLNGNQVCQNCKLANEPNIEISKEEICERYLNNPLTEAFVFGGLEPFDSSLDLMGLVDCIRRKYQCMDDIVIYTGYTEEELKEGIRDNTQPNEVLKGFWSELINTPNIIIKFGRYIDKDSSRYDDVLGVTLASVNQYARRISN